MKFSTEDRDNDNHDTFNCAADHNGWWHNRFVKNNTNTLQQHLKLYKLRRTCHVLMEVKNMLF